MTRNTATLITLLVLSLAAPLGGCDSAANLTEQEHIQRAKDFEDKGQLKGSILELKNAIQKNPDSPQARLLLGQVYLKAGLGAEAEKELTKAGQLGVSSESLKPQLGEALLLMGEYKRVIDEIEPGTQTSKNNLARILQLRADALLKQGKLNDACNLFQQSLDVDASNPPTYWGLAQCSLAARDLPKAREWLDSALKLNDKQAKTWVFIGSLEQLNNKLQDAMAAYTNSLKYDPNNLEALQNRAVLSMSLGQWEAARKDVDKTLKLSPKSIGTYYLQALYNFNQKKYAAARDHLQEVFKLAPDHVPSILLAGETAYALGSYQQAESLLSRFLAGHPGDVRARRFLAATQLKQKNPDKALETLAPLLDINYKDGVTLALASEAYRNMGKTAKAAELLERATLIDPNNALLKTQLGLTHLIAGDSHRAISVLEAATVLNSDQYEADKLLVQSHLENKAYDKALVAISAMEKKLPNSPVTHNLRGRALLGKNDLANARESFEKALAIDPTFFPSAASLSQLDMQANQPEAARKRFERLLDKDDKNLLVIMALAELAGINKQESEYIKWLNRAVQTHPEAIQPRAALVNYFMAKKEPKRAMTVANDAVNANPDNPAALNLLGTLQLSINEKSAAISTFTKLTKKNPQSPDAHRQLALAQIADKKLGNARTSLQSALQLDPRHLPSQETLLRLEIAENKPESALRIARQIQEQHPKSPLGFEREADILLAQKNSGQAIASYERALAQGASSAVLIKLHRAHIMANRSQAAEQVLTDWLVQHPEDITVRTYAAEQYMRNGQNKAAIAQFESILRTYPDNPLILNNLASLYQAEKDNRALATAERALKLAPDNPSIQDTLGWILVEQGQAPRGLDLLRKALANAPKVATIRYHHAVALARTGNNVLARKELQQLLKDAPNFAEAEAAKRLLQGL